MNRELLQMISPLIRLLSFVVCFLLTCASFLNAQQSGDLSLQQVLSRKLIKSPSRRFTVVSSDVREGLELTNWAEQIAVKVEQAIGIELPSGKSSIVRIVLYPEVRSVSKDSSRVMTTQELVDGQLVQRLLIYDYDNADPKDALETLCHLLLNSYVVNRLRALKISNPTLTINHQPSTIPYWLVVGMAQSLYSSLRARNSEVVLRRWQEGQLLPLAQFLRSKEPQPSLNHTSAEVPIAKRIGTEEDLSSIALAKEDQPLTVMNDADKAVCGLLFGWIQSFQNKRECFEKIFERLAAGKDVSPEWFVTCIPACNSIADLEEEWDNWILRQKDIVYEPGTITSGLIDNLKAELLLYPGNFGIPLTSSLDRWIEFRDLIEQRDASWIPAFSSSKGISLRLLAAGRGKEFGDVVDSYCRFLEALRRGKSRRTLEKLLGQADEHLKTLQKKIEDR